MVKTRWWVGLPLFFVLFFVGCDDGPAKAEHDGAMDLGELRPPPDVQEVEAPQDVSDLIAETVDGVEVDAGDTADAPDVSQDTETELEVVDSDNDTIPDHADNCPNHYNPDQADLDGDGRGDVCDPDMDGDGVPNEFDPLPRDPTFPGIASADTVYAHTEHKLFRMNVKTFELFEVGTFSFPDDGRDHSMTDIAIDQHGVIYGITFNALYVCGAQDARCAHLASFSGSFNGLTWLPSGAIGQSEEVLIAIDGLGGWHEVVLDIPALSATLRQLGSFGEGYYSSGDAFSILGMGTYAAVNKSNVDDCIIVRVDPATGTVLEEIAELTGTRGVWGLAGWTSRVYAFASDGRVLMVNLSTREFVELTAVPGLSWWGAGVRTIIN